MSENCDFCGKEIARYTAKGRFGRFCTKKCRDKYHNAKRRLERQRVIVLDEILWMQNLILNQGGELPEAAAAALYSIDKFVGVNRLEFTCSNCGQKRMDYPRLFDACAFCGQKVWKYTLKPVI